MPAEDAVATALGFVAEHDWSQIEPYRSSLDSKASCLSADSDFDLATAGCLDQIFDGPSAAVFAAATELLELSYSHLLGSSMGCLDSWPRQMTMYHSSGQLETSTDHYSPTPHRAYAMLSCA